MTIVPKPAYRYPIVLEDHYTGDEINAALARGGDFDDAFPGETEGSLDALRDLFRRKALVARQGRVCEALPGGGATAEDVAALSVADPPRSSRATARRSPRPTCPPGCGAQGW